MVGLPRVREPVLTGRQLQAWLSLLEHRTGVRVAPEREAYVRSVLEKRMSECGIQRADGYLARLARESDVEGGEWEVLLDRVLIGETSFFRHQPSFDFLSRLVATRLAAGGEPAPLTFWSVGCSTGEEAYSLAMVLTAAFRKAGCHPAFGVIATDLNRRSLEVAREGVYPPRALRGVDPAVVDEYFEPLPSGKRRIKAFLRRHVAFFHGNMLDPASSSIVRELDVVFCQNLLIYLRRWRRHALVRQLAGTLRREGVLVVGPGEVSGWTPPELARHEDRSVQAYRRVG